MTEEKTITDADLFRVLEWLQEHGKAAAQANADRVYLEKHLEHIRAKIAIECIEAGDSAAASDMKAKASEAYKTALEGLKVAVASDSYYRWQKTRCDALVSAWQTLSANKRSLERL